MVPDIARVSGTVRRRGGGRPPEAERLQRREAALDAALDEIVERGYEAVTMLDVARRAQSSKESLYAWFGTKQGLVAEVIRRQAGQTEAALERALRTDAPAGDALTAVAGGLLDLLLGPTSLALNRAAMTSPDLAEVLLQHGRHSTGPLVESYLRLLHERGDLDAADPAEAFRLFYGLVVEDSQIRALLGETPPSSVDRRRHAAQAVRHFLDLTRPERTRRGSRRSRQP